MGSPSGDLFSFDGTELPTCGQYVRMLTDDSHLSQLVAISGSVIPDVAIEDCHPRPTVASTSHTHDEILRTRTRVTTVLSAEERTDSTTGRKLIQVYSVGPWFTFGLELNTQTILPANLRNAVDSYNVPFDRFLLPSSPIRPRRGLSVMHKGEEEHDEGRGWIYAHLSYIEFEMPSTGITRGLKYDGPNPAVYLEPSSLRAIFLAIEAYSKDTKQQELLRTVLQLPQVKQYCGNELDGFSNNDRDRGGGINAPETSRPGPSSHQAGGLPSSSLPNTSPMGGNGNGGSDGELSPEDHQHTGRDPLCTYLDLEGLSIHTGKTGVSTPSGYLPAKFSEPKPGMIIGGPLPPSASLPSLEPSSSGPSHGVPTERTASLPPSRSLASHNETGQAKLSRKTIGSTIIQCMRRLVAK